MHQVVFLLLVQLREHNLVPRVSGCRPLFGDVYSVLSMPSKFGQHQLVMKECQSFR